MSVDRASVAGGGLVVAGGVAGTIGYHRLQGVLAATHSFETPKALADLSAKVAEMPAPLQESGKVIKLLDPRKAVEAIRYGTETAHLAAGAGAAAQSDIGKLTLLKPQALHAVSLLAVGGLVAAAGAGALVASLLD